MNDEEKEAEARAKIVASGKLHATLWSNRAAANMTLENYGHALFDCRKAVSINREPLKPYWRGAKCALKLHKWKDTVKFCEAGLSLHADSKDLLVMKEKAELRLAEEAEEEARTQKIRAEKAAEKEAFEAKIAGRGVKLGPKPEWFKGMYHLSGEHKPWLDEDDDMHWPCAFLYPEYGHSDFVQDFCEADFIQAQC